MGARLVAVGLVTLLGQVVLLRELNVAFFGSELNYALALALWLLASAGGALLGGKLRGGEAGLRGLFLAYALALPASVAPARAARILAGGVPGAFLPLERQLAVSVLLLLPAGLLSGLLFQRAARLHVERGGTLASAWGVESAGGLAGGALATGLLAAGVSNFAAALACGLGAAAASLLPRPGRRDATLGALVAAPLVAALALAPRLDLAMTGWSHPGLLASTDTPYGRATLARQGDQTELYADDALVFESAGTAAEEFVHAALLQHPAPQRVLVLGGAAQGLPGEALRHRPREVEDVEVDAALTALVRTHLPSAAADLADARVRLVVGDPRRHVAAARGWDVVLVGMPEPASGQANRFYTQEFFALAKAALAPGGVLALRLRGSENLWTPALAARNAGIHAALRAAFADVLVLPGSTNILLASDAPLAREASLPATRLQTRGLETRLVSAAWLRYVLENDRTAGIARLLAGTPAEPNTDARPACYAFTTMLWLSRFVPAAGRLEPAALRGRALAATAALAAGLLALLLVARRRPVLRGAVLAGLAGLAGMVLEVVLLLRYQTARGVLFRDLGLLLTMYMAGLAAGSLAAARPGPPGLRRRSKGARALPVALAALAALVAVLPAGAFASLVATSALLLAAGALSGALFARAGRIAGSSPEAVARVYAADLAGGCVGSLAASLLLVPLAGLTTTAAALGLLALAALLAV